MNEDRKAESDVRIWKNNHDILITRQSAMTIAGWFHSGQASRAYSFASSGVVQPDADMWDYVGPREYECLSPSNQIAIDALVAYFEAEKAIRHDDVPHKYGTRMICLECLAACQCNDLDNDECVHCLNQEDCGCTLNGSHYCLVHQVAIAKFFTDS